MVNLYQKFFNSTHMKQYFNEIVYIILLAMTFTFFAFMDELTLVAGINNNKINSTEKCRVEAVNNYMDDYNYSPMMITNGYN